MTFAEDIETTAGGQPIEAIVICECPLGEDDDGVVPPDRQGTVLSWEEARPLLDYDYDEGFGGVDCHIITAWTPDRVLFIHEYDGSTEVTFVPRNPTREAFAP